jgi:hypothetical protein
MLCIGLPELVLPGRAGSFLFHLDLEGLDPVPHVYLKELEFALRERAGLY